MINHISDFYCIFFADFSNSLKTDGKGLLFLNHTQVFPVDCQGSLLIWAVSFQFYSFRDCIGFYCVACFVFFPFPNQPRSKHWHYKKADQNCSYDFLWFS